MDHHADRAAALAGLQARWGSAAPRPAMEVFGALAAAPFPAEVGAAPALPGNRPGGRPGILPERPALVPLPGGAEPAPAVRQFPGSPARDPARDAVRDAARAIPTGFPELDALLATGGLPRTGTVAFRGAGSSGATTLALRAAAEAQAGGALVAWIDLARSLDPVEAVARGVRLEWLAVLVPGSAEEALEMAGTLLQARAVDLLVLDLAGHRAWVGGGAASDARARAAGSATSNGAGARAGGVATPGPARGSRRPRPADQLTRLVAFARRAGALLLVLEPADAAAPLRAALEEGVSLRLELRRRGWIRLGREVVGQRTEVRVAKDRHGAPDRRTAIRLLYAEGGPRDRCLARDDLLAEAVADTGTTGPATPARHPFIASSTSPEHQESTDAPPPPLLATSRPAARTAARSGDPGSRAADPGRAAVG